MPHIFQNAVSVWLISSIRGVEIFQKLIQSQKDIMVFGSRTAKSVTSRDMSWVQFMFQKALWETRDLGRLLWRKEYIEDFV